MRPLIIEQEPQLVLGRDAGHFLDCATVAGGFGRGSGSAVRLMMGFAVRAAALGAGVTVGLGERVGVREYSTLDDQSLVEYGRSIERS
jgi:hypothetical protein